MDNVVLYIICSFFSSFLRALRIVLLNTNNKILAASVNSLTFATAALVTKFVCNSSWEIAFIIECISNFFGCYIAMVIKDYIKKNGITETN